MITDEPRSEKNRVNRVPRDASDEQILDIVRAWVDVLANKNYAGIFAAIGYALAFGRPGADCIKDEIRKYRSPEYFPNISEFTVSNWRTADGGNPAPIAKVTWYQPSDSGMVGSVWFDLPINGCWSDLTADFVFFENDNINEGYFLGLEEIGSQSQREREMDQE